MTYVQLVANSIQLAMRRVELTTNNIELATQRVLLAPHRVELVVTLQSWGANGCCWV